jgi:plastocyanin
MDERIAPAPDLTRSHLVLRGWALLVSLAVLLVSAGGASAADQTVTAQSTNTFNPSTVTINPGDTVTWNNSGGTHNVVFTDGLFTMPISPVAPGSTAWPVARTFNSLGTFSYFCGNPAHTGMDGAVSVNAAPPPGGGGGTPPPPGADPDPGTPGQPKTELKLRLKLSDATPRRGGRVRFFGSVRPAIDGRVLIQRRGRKRSYRTVARVILKDRPSTSTFSRRLRAAPGVYRARIRASADHEAATSSTKRVKFG